MKNFLYMWFYNIQNAVTKMSTELTNDFLVGIYFRNYTDPLENFVNFKVDLQKAMKFYFKVKMKVTIEFLVEIYFRNDRQFFEKYFTWENI